MELHTVSYGRNNMGCHLCIQYYNLIDCVFYLHFIRLCVNGRHAYVLLLNLDTVGRNFLSAKCINYFMCTPSKYKVVI
jgi:hypothetical protein